MFYTTPTMFYTTPTLCSTPHPLCSTPRQHYVLHYTHYVLHHAHTMFYTTPTMFYTTPSTINRIADSWNLNFYFDFSSRPSSAHKLSHRCNHYVNPTHPPLPPLAVVPLDLPATPLVCLLLWACYIFHLQTVRFKNELERNITIKLGYANAKVCQPRASPTPNPRQTQTPLGIQTRPLVSAGLLCDKIQSQH